MKNLATIISVYHGDVPENFREAIESVLAQNFDEEVNSRIYLAVDGPVPKPLEAMIRSVEEKLYRVVWLKENTGLANALNTLIEQLENEEYVFRMDADDSSYPDRYKTQLSRLEERPSVDILGTNIVEINSETGACREVAFAKNSKEARARLWWRVPVAHPTVCFRRHVLDAVGGYPNVKFNEDIALWFKCAELGFNFDNVQEPLYNFRIDGNFWNRRGISKALIEWRCYIEGGMRLDGLSWKVILPTARLLMRLSPKWFKRALYASSFR